MKANILSIHKGHEIWLEPVKEHYHKGEKAVIKAGWGHAMKPDGLCEKEKCNAYVLTPDNKRIELPIQENEGDYYILSFELDDEGIYTVVMENNYGIGTKLKNGSFERGPKKDYENAEYSTYFYQYAKTFIVVGHNETVFPDGAGNELEIIPLNLCRSIRVKVMYEGKEFPGAKIVGTHKNYEGKDFPVTATTDQDGIASMSLNKDGIWMFRVEKVDEAKKINEFYDKTNIRATLTIPIK